MDALWMFSKSQRMIKIYRKMSELRHDVCGKYYVGISGYVSFIV